MVVAADCSRWSRSRRSRSVASNEPLARRSRALAAAALRLTSWWPAPPAPWSCAGPTCGPRSAATTSPRSARSSTASRPSTSGATTSPPGSCAAPACAGFQIYDSTGLALGIDDRSPKKRAGDATPARRGRRLGRPGGSALAAPATSSRRGPPTPRVAPAEFRPDQAYAAGTSSGSSRGPAEAARRSSPRARRPGRSWTAEPRRGRRLARDGRASPTCVRRRCVGRARDWRGGGAHGDERRLTLRRSCGSAQGSGTSRCATSATCPCA